MLLEAEETLGQREEDPDCVAVSQETRRVAWHAKRRGQEPEEAGEVSRLHFSAAEAVESLPRASHLSDLVHGDPGLMIVDAFIFVEDDECAEVQEEVARHEDVASPEGPARSATPAIATVVSFEALDPGEPRVRRRRDEEALHALSRRVKVEAGDADIPAAVHLRVFGSFLALRVHTEAEARAVEEGPNLGSKRVIQHRFNVGLPRARVR